MLKPVEITKTKEQNVFFLLINTEYLSVFILPNCVRHKIQYKIILSVYIKKENL